MTHFCERREGRAGRAAFAAAFVALCAAPATAQVAVALASNDDDVSQRDIAAAVVNVARTRWQMLSPHIPAAALKKCKTGDTMCLRAVAAEGHASHLLVVGVAALAVRDHVVAVQLFEVANAAPLFEDSAVQTGALDELKEVGLLANRLVEVPGPPPFVPPHVTEAPGIVSAQMSSWAWAGFGLVAAAGLTAAGSGSIGGLLMIDNPSQMLARNVFFYGLVASGALAAAGTAAFIIDEL